MLLGMASKFKDCVSYQPRSTINNFIICRLSSSAYTLVNSRNYHWETDTVENRFKKLSQFTMNSTLHVKTYQGY